MELKIDLNTDRLLRERGLGPNEKVQQFIDSEVLRRCEPYLPKVTGGLAKAGILGTKVGSGKVRYNGPAARFLYYGKVMVGQDSRSAFARLGERKVVTGKDLSYDTSANPRAGKLWFERMKTDHGGEILRGVAALAGGKAK